MKKYYILFFAIFVDKIICNDPMTLYKQQLEFCDQLKDPKVIEACKKNIMLLAAMQNNSNQIKPEQSNQNIESPKYNNIDNTTPEVLNHFANIITNFGKITADAHNKANITQNLLNIVAEIINITAVMTRK